MRIGLSPMLPFHPEARQEKFGPNRTELDISSRPDGLPVVPGWRSRLRTQIALTMHSPPHAALSERSVLKKEMPGIAQHPTANHRRWLSR